MFDFNNGMEVSFTGINNLYIGKKAYSKFGSFLSQSGAIKQGNQDCLEVLIKCDVTDDARGNHLSEFVDAVGKCHPEIRDSFISKEKPNHLKLLTKRVRVDDNPRPVEYSILKLNEGEAVIENRDILGLYSYLARLTRDIVSMDNVSEAQKHYAKVVNRSIHNEAMDYIDNIM